MYIIKGSYKKGDLYYFKQNNINYKAFMFDISNATIFKNQNEAIKECMMLNDISFKVYNIGPFCNHEYDTPPAISRKDNKTYICSNCGAREVIYDFIKKEPISWFLFIYINFVDFLFCFSI